LKGLKARKEKSAKKKRHWDGEGKKKGSKFWERGDEEVGSLRAFERGGGEQRGHEKNKRTDAK